MAYLIDDFVTDLNTYIKANLGTYITAINTEKGDSLLEAFDTNAYFVQTLDDRVANYEQFVFIQAGNPALEESNAAVYVETYPVAVYLIFPTNNLDEKNANRIFRYSRALRETVLSGYWSVAKKKFKLQGLDVMAFVELNDTRPVISTGLTLEVSFGY